MPHISLDILDALLLASREQPGEFTQEVRLVTAIHYLREKRLSPGQAAKLARMNRLDFLAVFSAGRTPTFVAID